MLCHNVATNYAHISLKIFVTNLTETRTPTLT